MMVSPPASPDGAAKSRPQSMMAQSSPEAVKRPRPQSMMYRPSTSNSRPSISSKHENGSRTSDDDGRTSVKVGKSLTTPTIGYLLDRSLTLHKLFASAHRLALATQVLKIFRSVSKDPWCKSQRLQVWVLIRRKAGNFSSSIVYSGRTSPKEASGTTFPTVLARSCKVITCQFWLMDNRGRASHTLWGLQARGNRVIPLPWVS
jgi:hypothetical protein